MKKEHWNVEGEIYLTGSYAAMCVFHTTMENM